MRYKMIDDATAAKYRRTFNLLKNAENWKLPTKPVTTKTHEDAENISRAIIFFVGGAEIKRNSDKTYTVTSQGYYHYIGA